MRCIVSQSFKDPCPQHAQGQQVEHALQNISVLFFFSMGVLSFFDRIESMGLPIGCQYVSGLKPKLAFEAFSISTNDIFPSLSFSSFEQQSGWQK
jgi:hypothetical protein